MKSHDKFRDKHGLAIPLLSDENGAVVERFGVWVEKSMYGRNFMGIERATFLIDAAGIVRRVWPSVKVAGHVDEVLAAARALCQPRPQAFCRPARARGRAPGSAGFPRIPSVDPQGTVARVWRNVKVPRHVEAVLAAASAL